jgi:large subunit ribosomal protein L21e
MTKSRGFRVKTRSLLRRKPRERGKSTLSNILRKYNIEDKVLIKIDPSVQKGMPHRRYHGKIGKITGIRGRAYLIDVMQGNAIKEIIVLPEHLEPY